MSSISLNFNVGPEYPAEFPRSIDLSTTESLSYSSFAENFQANQQACLPYYSLTVVESGNRDERYYHVYDTVYFSINKYNQTGPLLDPSTKRPVKKVHHFVMNCFAWDDKLICKPINLSTTPNLILKPLQTDGLEPEVQTMLLDSMNVNLFTANTAERQKGRRTQYIIADLIERGQLFDKLSLGEKRQEIMQWLWCSAQGSYIGVLKLFQTCQVHLSTAKDHVINLLTIRLSILQRSKVTLSSSERSAAMEGFDLLKQIKEDTRKKGKKCRLTVSATQKTKKTHTAAAATKPFSGTERKERIE